MTSDYVILEIGLCMEVGNDEYIIVCNFGGCRMSGFEVIDMGPPSPPPLPRRSHEEKKARLSE